MHKSQALRGRRPPGPPIAGSAPGHVADVRALLLRRQARNEPCNVSMACQHVAQIKKLDVETVAKVTSQNALKLFPKLRQVVETL